MNKYNNGKIYKIVDNTDNNIYIGSTCQKYLSRRLAGHRADYNKYKNIKNLTSFKILKNNNYYIELIENYPCSDRYELEKRERFYIENNNCVNKAIPTQTKKEYMDKYINNNRNEINNKKKIHYEKNKEKLLDEKKEYYQKIKHIKNQKIICECGKQINNSSLKRHIKTKKHINIIKN